mgnify:CR=1 FL=1
MGKGGKININKIMFEELTFADLFETFDEEYLTMMAQKNPDQLKRMCVFLSLDNQLQKEQLAKMPKSEMN